MDTFFSEWLDLVQDKVQGNEDLIVAFYPLLVRLYEQGASAQDAADRISDEG